MTSAEGGHPNNEPAIVKQDDSQGGQHKKSTEIGVTVPPRVEQDTAEKKKAAEEEAALIKKVAEEAARLAEEKEKAEAEAEKRRVLEE